MAKNRELNFLQELMCSGDMGTVIDNSITSRFFTGKYKKAFSYIQKHQREYGKLPTYNTFIDKTDIQLDLNKRGHVKSTGESMKYWCDEIRDKLKHNTMAEALEVSLQLINEGNVTDVMQLMTKTLNDIESFTVVGEYLNITEGTAKRKEEYLKAQKCGGMTGIPSGITHWDNLIGGYQKGELVTAMGYTGTGKSWWELIQAVYLSKEGYNVLLMTTEMSVKLMQKRIDAIWCNLNYTRFKKGQLLPDEEKRYFAYLEEMADLNLNGEGITLIVGQSTGGVNQISAKIDQYKPDIVFIDGAYLLENDEGDDDNWLSMVKIWRGLHKLALQKDIPVIVTTQSKDEENATLKSAQFAKAISQDCDVFVVLEQTQEMKYDRELRMRPLKLREGSLLSSVTINWDFDAMDYSSLYTKEDNPNENIKSSVDNSINL